MTENLRNEAMLTSGSCDRASLMYKKKEPTDDTSKDVYSLLAHVSGIIMPVEYIHSRSALSSCPVYTLPQPAHPG